MAIMEQIINANLESITVEFYRSLANGQRAKNIYRSVDYSTRMLDNFYYTMQNGGNKCGYSINGK